MHVIFPRPLKRVLGKIIPFSLYDLIPTFNLGTGTADGTTYLRGDQTWSPVPDINAKRHYGAFQDTTTQSNQTANAMRPMIFNTTDLSYGITVEDHLSSFTGSRLTNVLTVTGTPAGIIYTGMTIIGTGWETATFTASISAKIMTVSSISSGTIRNGDYLRDGIIFTDTKVVLQLTGTTGGAGTYLINNAQTLLSSPVKAYGIVINGSGTGTGGTGTYLTSTSGIIASTSLTGTLASKITIQYAGVYNFQWSGQFQNADNAIHDINVWIKINGVDVPGSNGKIASPARKSAIAGDEGHTISGWNFLLSFNAGDYIELYWTTNNVLVTIKEYPGSNPPPSTASLIATVTQQY